jgi:hypothetical protein
MGGARNMRGYSLEDIGPRRLARNTTTDRDEIFNFGGLFSLFNAVIQRDFESSLKKLKQ